MNTQLASIATRFEPDPKIKNVLVTGAAGFIASWLTSHLVQQYSKHYNVIAYDNMCRPASINNLEHLNPHSNFKFIKGDVCNAEFLLKTMTENSIDTVMHLAAQTSVDDSYERPMDSVTSNVTGTYTLLECSRKSNVQKFIYMSTDEVYGPCGPDAPATEEAPLRPTNPYSASKASGEMLVHSYHKSFKLPVIVVRSNNAYGPNQYPEKIIPKFCLRIQRGEKLTVMDKGLESRCYLFVQDLVNGLDTILHKHRGTEYAMYNIASTDNFTTLGVTLEILAAFGFRGSKEELVKEWVVPIPSRPFHDMYYFTNCDKLKALGWEQKMPFSRGLEITAAWYRGLRTGWWKDY